ncbi:MAG: PQQ-dependent sugar dehydrogenase [Anaerolineae bacterium]|nr:PQQ-dependent sugar dehydrogenase [Anaerolineae bacterium]
MYKRFLRLHWGTFFIFLMVACRATGQFEGGGGASSALDISKTADPTAVPLIGPPASPVTAVALHPVLAAGLRKPVYLTHAGDGPQDGRLFVAEQDGRVRIIQNGELLAQPFLDISANLATDGSERGLLGLAFHPQYAQNGYFYIVYTNKDGDTEIARYTVSAADPHQADPDSVQRLFLIDQPYGNHNGGQLVFGPDGYFYIGLGDGGAVGDPYDNAQDPGTLLGSILRIDINKDTPYTIPHDNPFVGQRRAKGEVWMLGLRNPWAFSFDALTGDLYITDVAQEGLEEINFHPANSPAGVNFGWPYREGSQCYDAESCRSEGLRMPIFEYPHGEDGCAVIGGQVYRGQQFPTLAGNYFFSDFCSGRIWALRYDAGAGEWVRTAVAETNTQVSTIGADAAGELYVVDYRHGAIWQIRSPDK